MLIGFFLLIFYMLGAQFYDGPVLYKFGSCTKKVEAFSKTDSILAITCIYT